MSDADIENVELESESALDQHVLAGCVMGFCLCPSLCTIDENIIRYRIEEPKV
jgi:hypothetical protein